MELLLSVISKLLENYLMDILIEDEKMPEFYQLEVEVQLLLLAK
jgi:hypothetical protein